MSRHLIFRIVCRIVKSTTVFLFMVHFLQKFRQSVVRQSVCTTFSLGKTRMVFFVLLLFLLFAHKLYLFDVDQLLGCFFEGHWYFFEVVGQENCMVGLPLFEIGDFRFLKTQT